MEMNTVRIWIESPELNCCLHAYFKTEIFLLYQHNIALNNMIATITWMARVALRRILKLEALMSSKFGICFLKFSKQSFRCARLQTVKQRLLCKLVYEIWSWQRSIVVAWPRCREGTLPMGAQNFSISNKTIRRCLNFWCAEGLNFFNAPAYF